VGGAISNNIPFTFTVVVGSKRSNWIDKTSLATVARSKSKECLDAHKGNQQDVSKHGSVERQVQLSTLRKDKASRQYVETCP
jgi:hypothetical protein